jgi:hypothetical protein
MSEDIIVLGGLGSVACWTYIVLPLIYHSSRSRRVLSNAGARGHGSISPKPNDNNRCLEQIGGSRRGL